MIAGTYIQHACEIANAIMDKFPVEAREMILAQLYVQDEPIVLKRHGHSKRFTGLPMDPYKYLSRQCVGRAVSQEVARVFYGQSTSALNEDIHWRGLSTMISTDLRLHPGSF